jgi:hypothetical protein
MRHRVWSIVALALLCLGLAAAGSPSAEAGYAIPPTPGALLLNPPNLLVP